MAEEHEESRTDSHKKYGKLSGKPRALISRLLVILQTAATIWILYEVYSLNMLPLKYLGAVAAVLFCLDLIPWILTFRRAKAARAIGSVISLCVIAVAAVGGYYLQMTNQTLADITNTQKVVTQTDNIVVVVMADSAYQSLSDLAGKPVGYQAVMDSELIANTLTELNDALDPDVESKEYSGMADMVQALYDGEVEAILYNETYLDMITDEFESFEDETRVLDTYSFETEVKVDVEEEEEIDVATDSFILYMSGIDRYGSVSGKSRSDVNIMAVVNRATKQILLVTTPRDYYVELANIGQMDKLTHAGIYGIDCSMKTLENLYDVNINYYLRLNFTGFMHIVDALDGVDVYSSKSFTSEVGGYYFSEGTNHVNGEQALGFVRERHAFGDGDFQRQKNQMEMIKAIVQKAASPSILTSYTSLLKSLEDSFSTNMSADDIGALVKAQLSDGGDWNVQSFGVSGEGTRKSTYSMGSRKLYVCLQDADSIAQAKALMERVMNGEIISEDDLSDGSQE